MEEDEMVQANGFRLVAARALLEDQGGVFIDYLTGPFRKGFQIKGKRQAGCDSGCSC